MKKIIKLTESDLTRLVKRIIKETKEIDEIFGFGKRRRDGGDDYVKVEKFRGKNDVKLIQKNGVEPYVGNDRVEFTFSSADGDRIELRAVYHKNGKSLRTETTRFNISNDEQDRLNNKYFN